ncbi:MAG: HD domain-containing protein [bacterium]|nr:HD domain-containing protein [bacterium]
MSSSPNRRLRLLQRRLTPSFRILILVASAAVVSLTAVALVQVQERHLRRTLLEEAESHLLLEARNLATASTDALLSDFPELTLVPMVREIRSSRPELRLVSVVDHTGLIAGHDDPRLIGSTYSPPLIDAPLTRAYLNPSETMGTTGELIIVTTPVNHHTQGRIGRVTVGLARSFIDGKIHQARSALILVAAILAICAILIALVMNAVLMRPLSRLQAGVRRIGQGDLDTKAEVSGPIEFRRLAITVNEMADQLKETREIAAEREEEIIATQREVITTLGDVVESRSHETANHTRRVGAMCYELSLLAGLPEDEAALMRLASPMHDVGKIGIPDSILNKPGKLTDDEYTTMKKHAEIGHSILAGSERPIMKAAAIIAHEHHERWDGKGYPLGIMGEKIHIYGRIVAIVDVFDALFCDRVYRPAMPLNRVLAIISEERGHHFDPHLVDLFLTNLDLFLNIMDKLKDESASPVKGLESPVEEQVEEPELIGA